MQIKTTLRFYLAPVRGVLIIKSTQRRKQGKKESPYTVGRNAN
jgi:hypothetical protein